MPWADIVIPVATTYESDHPFEARMTGEGMWLMARNKVVEPLGAYKSDYEFWLDLACRMGYGDDFWNGDIEACMDWQLQNLGITMKELREHPAGVVYKPNPPQFEKFAQTFSTPSLRSQGSRTCRRARWPSTTPPGRRTASVRCRSGWSLPRAHTATPGLLERYPLTLFDTHTTDVFNHGWLHNVPCLREVHPDPWVHVHPDTARARGIEDGDWVVVESPHGSIKVRAVHFPGIRPDTVMGIHGCWQSCEELGLPGQALLDGGANANLLYSIDPDKAFDPVVSAMAKQTLVELRRVDGEAEEQPVANRFGAADPGHPRRRVAVGRRVDSRQVAVPGPDQVGFLFDESRCVECRTCEVACKATRDVEPGVNWRHVKEESTGEYPTPAVSSFSLSCMHCAAPSVSRRAPQARSRSAKGRCRARRQREVRWTVRLPRVLDGLPLRRASVRQRRRHAEVRLLRRRRPGAGLHAVVSRRSHRLRPVDDLRTQAAGKAVRELRSAGGPSIVVVH